MDSLLANYASSEEEEDEKAENNSAGSLMSSLPPPKTCSLFASLPQPKRQQNPYKNNNNTTTSLEQSSSPFQSLPQPISNSNSSLSQPKRVVQFRPPPSIRPQNLEDDDDEGDIKEEKQGEALKPSSSSVKSFLSSIPAPRNSSTLGVATTGSGRRSILETEPTYSQPLPEPPVADASYVNYDSGVYSSDGGNYESGSYTNYDAGVHSCDEGYYDSGNYSNEGSYANYGRYDGGNYSNYDPGVHISNEGSYGRYDGGSSNGQQGSSNWGDGAVFRGRGKRGWNEIPTEIVEVKQDELIKDRPREDQVKLTGIAFGPSYQPVSNKGKPTKLHKRKHQIGSLYFDMKQKEMELQERRAKGFLTKAETQAKYGW